MNTFKKVMASIFAFCVLSASSNLLNAQPGAQVSFQVFYDNLSPYGQWVHDPGYGYVWVPEVANDFRPYYSSGHWVMTDYGNMWVSDYPWGWAPFHYGRWTYDSFYGWVWVPGNEWGPSWVAWRTGGGYYGWAPLRPGISIDIAFSNYNPPNDWWVFIPPAYVHNPSFYNYYRGPRYNTTIIHNTTIINNTYVNNNVRYITGPRASEIKQVTHHDVQVYQVKNNQKPGRSAIANNTVAVYRPHVNATSQARGPASDKIIKENRRVGDPQPISTNGGRPERLNSNKTQQVKNVNPKPGTNQSTQSETIKQNPQVNTGTSPKKSEGNPPVKKQENQIPERKPANDIKSNPEKIPVKPEHHQQNTSVPENKNLHTDPRHIPPSEQQDHRNNPPSEHQEHRNNPNSDQQNRSNNPPKQEHTPKI